jgi:hypothetical protein
MQGARSILLLRSLGACSNYRSVHLSACRGGLFYEKDEKGGYRKESDIPSRTQMIRDGFKELKGEIKLWKQEVKEKFTMDPLVIMRKGDLSK